jgi:glutathione S-transferase
MKLYHQARTRSSRVKWLLEELGVPYELQVVEIFSGGGRAPEYQRAVHPHGYVPALEDEGLVLIESAAICMHLADRHGGGRLAPPVGSLARARYYEWMVYIPATVDPVLETVMFHTVFMPEAKRIPVLVERAKKTWTTKIEPRLSAALATGPWILGESFSAADVMVGNAVAWARMAGVLGEDPVLTHYLTTVSARPAFLAGHS